MYRHLSLLTASLGLLPATAHGASLIASHYSGKVYTLEFTDKGKASSLVVTAENAECGLMPSWLELYPEDKTLFCFDETFRAPGIIASYDVADNGQLSLAGSFANSGFDCHGALYGGPEGKSFIASAQYSPSSIITYKNSESPTNPALQVEKFTLAAPGPNPRQEAPHPHQVLPDPTGDFLLVPDLGADVTRVFKIDHESGALTACGAAEAAPGDGPRHATWWTPDGSTNSTEDLKLFVINELTNSVSLWEATYENECISFTKTQTTSTYPPGYTPNSAAKASEIRTFGNFLYAGNRADESFGAEQDSLATFTIDPVSGELTFVETTNAHSFYPRTFQINKAGTLIAVGGQTSSTVVIIRRDCKTGRLGKVVASVQAGPRGTPNSDNGLSAVIWNE